MAERHRKQIVLLTDCLSHVRAGAEKQIFELAKRVDRERFALTTVSLETEGKACADDFARINARLLTFRVVRIYSPAGFLQGFRFMQYLRREKVDVLMTYHFSSDIWGTFWAKCAGVPVIISNRRDMGFWRERRHLRAYNLINRWVTKIVAVSQSVKTKITREESHLVNKVSVIHNGVDLPAEKYSKDELCVLKQSLDLKEDDIVIAHVANLKPVKGHAFLLRAYKEIAAVDDRVKLLVIGEDNMNGELEHLSRELGLEGRVLFLGARHDVRTLLAAADICVLPSLSEGLSNAILEYLAAGKPVVATRVGGNPELIRPGENGFLVEPQDVSGLGRALLELLRSPEQRERMGQAGLRRVQEQFSMEAMVNQYERIFEGGRV